MPLTQEQLAFTLQVQHINKVQSDFEVSKDLQSAMFALAEYFEEMDNERTAFLFKQMGWAVGRLGYSGFSFVDMPTPFTDEVVWQFLGGYEDEV